MKPLNQCKHSWNLLKEYTDSSNQYFYKIVVIFYCLKCTEVQVQIKDLFKEK